MSPDSMHRARPTTSIGALRAELVTVIRTVVRREPGLVVVGVSGLVLAVVCMVGVAIRGRFIPPEGKLFAAGTFAFGVGVYTLTIAVLLPLAGYSPTGTPALATGLLRLRRLRAVARDAAGVPRPRSPVHRGGRDDRRRGGHRLRRHRRDHDGPVRAARDPVLPVRRTRRPASGPPRHPLRRSRGGDLLRRRRRDERERWARPRRRRQPHASPTASACTGSRPCHSSPSLVSAGALTPAGSRRARRRCRLARGVPRGAAASHVRGGHHSRRRRSPPSSWPVWSPGPPPPSSPSPRWRSECRGARRERPPVGHRGGRRVLRFEGLTGDDRYGPAEQRRPPRTASIFGVTPAAPWGLELVAHDVEGPVRGGPRVVRSGADDGVGVAAAA